MMNNLLGENDTTDTLVLYVGSEYTGDSTLSQYFEWFRALTG